MKKFSKLYLIVVCFLAISTLTIGILPLSESFTKDYRSLKYVINRFIFQKKEMIATSNHGSIFAFIPKDAVGRTIYKTGNYEPRLTKFILDDIIYTKDDIFIDVGANIGWYSILLSKLDYGPGAIYSFEPDELNYELLLKNIGLNNSLNVHPINKALSNKPGKATLYKYKDSNLGRHSLLPIKGSGESIVETTTLDVFAKESGIEQKNIKLIKVDVEGFEYFVLNGGRNLLKNTSYLIHEFSPSLIDNGGSSLDELITELGTLNMRPYILSGSKLVEVEEIRKLPEGQNIIWKSIS